MLDSLKNIFAVADLRKAHESWLPAYMAAP